MISSMSDDANNLDIAKQLDAQDPLARHRSEFVYADDTIYLDGNSLGRLPKRTEGAIAELIAKDWGKDLIRSWPTWIERADAIADRLAREVLGVAAGQVALSDSTTVNLYKLASAALYARPGRRKILIEQDNFPTDLYVLQGLAASTGHQIVTIPSDINEGLSLAEITRLLDEDVALVCLSHVAYRSGALADMVAITDAAHEVGALTLWDLSHSVGSVETPLAAAGADLAVGCTYKYLNSGPGAPAFVYVRADLHGSLRQPIWGWFGQSEQFEMGSTYNPIVGIERFLTGTPNMLGITAVSEGLRTVSNAGVRALRTKGIALTSYLIELADAWLSPLGFTLATPRDPARRGSHVTLHHESAWQICQAMIAAGVVPDYRTPDRLRLGPAPLTTSFQEVWVGLDRLRTIVVDETYRQFPVQTSAVT